MSELIFNSRRSPLLTCHAAASSDVPLATNAAIAILKNGGNAADAAVAMAAALNVTLEPSTGIGGDAFCLFYNSKTKKVHAINGSGRTSSALTLAKVKADGFSTDNMYPITHGYAVTVPGAAAAWVDTVSTFGSGKLSLAEILQPAITLAEDGFPVTEVNAYWWKKGEPNLKTELNIHGKDLLIDGHAPRHGQLFKRPKLANVFREVVRNGKKGFYEGWIAQAIVDAVKRHGGVMTTQDLADHMTTFEEPISTNYNGVRLWEIPPNGQGIIALMALNLLEQFDLNELDNNSAEYLHLMTEVLKLSFADGYKYVGDPAHSCVPVQQMLSKERAKVRAALISKDSARQIDPDMLEYKSGTDTTYFTIVDQDGNACSFIASKYHGFGSAIVPEGCGFTLQDRGSSFNLDEGHANCIGPNKRPFHTIIPAMLTSDKTGELLCSYGVMGGNMQPQGHVQVLLNMLQYGMDPQRALNQPRINVEITNNSVYRLLVEDGIPDDVVEILKSKGHEVVKLKGHERSSFGRGHVITKGSWWAKSDAYCHDSTGSVLWTGTDPRCDGLAVGY